MTTAEKYLFSSYRFEFPFCIKLEKLNAVAPGQEHLNPINFAAVDFFAHSKSICHQPLIFLPVNPLKKLFLIFTPSSHPSPMQIHIWYKVNESTH